MNKTWIIIGGIALFLLIIIGVFVGQYNGFVSRNENVDNSWAQVESQYQRRADLIPNLVATVKGITGQELAVYTEVARLRSQWQQAQTSGTAAEQVAATSALESGIGRLIASFEAYPELKSNENFLALQDELAGTENRIAVERKRYNDAVRDYNIAIKRFPGRFFAGLYGFGDRTYFEADTGSENAPQVIF
ncbi:MAG: LemA family protein [Nanoarchaeota archaeon]